MSKMPTGRSSLQASTAWISTCIGYCSEYNFAKLNHESESFESSNAFRKEVSSQLIFIFDLQRDVSKCKSRSFKPEFQGSCTWTGIPGIWTKYSLSKHCHRQEYQQTYDPSPIESLSANSHGPMVAVDETEFPICERATPVIFKARQQGYPVGRVIRRYIWQLNFHLDQARSTVIFLTEFMLAIQHSLSCNQLQFNARSNWIHACHSTYAIDCNSRTVLLSL